VWSQGENRLVVSCEPGAVEVHSHFDPDPSCHVCTLHNVPSRFVDAGYDVRVFLPPGYDENTLERFPVVYLNDGQNLFFPGHAPGGKHWRVDETLKQLDSMNLVRRVIAVGVYPRDRMHEYTGPGLRDYGTFAASELVPWIDAHYRTRAEPKHRAVAGSSLGGVAALMLGWEHPDVFGAVVCMSSTFGYADALLERVLTEKPRKLRIYLDSGWPRDNYEATKNLFHALRSRGWREGKDLQYAAFPGAMHNEDAWATRLHLPMQWLVR
jgi:enterochelin esterase-like enzyme